jgi:hypothetical protein
VRGRAPLTNNDSWFFVQIYQWFPSILEVATVGRKAREADKVGITVG